MTLEIERIETGNEGKHGGRLELDPKGFFVIMVDAEKGEMVAEHYENVEEEGRVVSGRLVRVFVGPNAEAICQSILEHGAVSRMDHAAYLGRELQKAEAALRMGKRYVQDEDL